MDCKKVIDILSLLFNDLEGDNVSTIQWKDIKEGLSEFLRLFTSHQMDWPILFGIQLFIVSLRRIYKTKSLGHYIIAPV